MSIDYLKTGGDNEGQSQDFLKHIGVISVSILISPADFPERHLYSSFVIPRKNSGSRVEEKLDDGLYVPHGTIMFLNNPADGFFFTVTGQ